MMGPLVKNTRQQRHGLPSALRIHSAARPCALSIAMISSEVHNPRQVCTA